MGTRNLTVVVKDNEIKVAQYGQWDGYPSGAGVEILSFVSCPNNLSNLEKALGKVRFATEQELEDHDNAAGSWDKQDTRTGEQIRWFHTFATGDLGWKILTRIIETDYDEVALVDKRSFANDGLFCEYAYVIDLDNRNLEVYEGFNRGDVKAGRFADYEREDEEYAPVGLVETYSLNDLPSQEEFLQDLESDEEDC